MNHSHSNILVSRQPIHDPKQVTDMNQIKIGTKFRRFGKGTDSTVYTVTRIKGGRSPEVFFRTKKGTRSLSLFASDYAIVCYESGAWNSQNYIVLV